MNFEVLLYCVSEWGLTCRSALAERMIGRLGRLLKCIIFMTSDVIVLTEYEQLNICHVIYLFLNFGFGLKLKLTSLFHFIPRTRC